VHDVNRPSLKAVLAYRIRRYARQLAARLEQSVIADSPKDTAFGFELVDKSMQSHDASQKHFMVLKDALALIESNEPGRISRIRRGVDRIIVDDLPGRGGEYRDEYQAAVVSTEVVEAGCHAAALVLIHESTHGRLQRLGFRYHVDRRGQIERICTKREISFLRRFENTREYIVQFEAQAQRPGLSELELWLSERDKIAGRFELMGLPSWLVRLFQRVERWGRARAVARYNHALSDSKD
jgi:hypothetical protein